MSDAHFMSTDPRVVEAAKGADAAIERLKKTLIGKDTSRKDRGPRPTPKAQSPRKARRVAVRTARHQNR